MKPHHANDLMASSQPRHLHTPAFRYFAAVVEYGSIRGAARELNVASSAVNRQILWLEQSLGADLFDRIGRRLQLSPAGEILIRHVRETLHDYEATLAEIDGLRGLRRGTVRIATVESVSETILPALIEEFRAAYPLIRVIVTIGSSEKVARDVEMTTVDIGFTFNPPASRALDITMRRELQIGALMAQEHPLAGNKKISIDDCLDYPLALPSHGLSLRAGLDQLLADYREKASVLIESNSLRFMKAIVQDGKTIAFQTAIGLEGDLDTGNLVFKPLSDGSDAREELVVVIRSGRTLRLAPDMFHELAQARIAALIHEI